MGKDRTVMVESKEVVLDKDELLRRVMKSKAVNKTIILSSVDSGYLDMAINLYMSSFGKFRIENYLFVGSDAHICDFLFRFAIDCQPYIYDKDGETPSVYNTQAFRRKTHLKTKIILEGLKLGLNVLITDVDIVFQKNPLSSFTCQNCDIEITSDVSEGNSGFYFARPTEAAIELHEKAWNVSFTNPKLSNQKAIVRTIKEMQQKKKISVKNLSPSQYPNGYVYFEQGKRMFKGDNPCSECIIVHNNWIVSGAAKIYRFKEYGLWENDAGGYFSSASRKYLSFDLPKQFDEKDNRTAEQEKIALQNAFIIGDLLNRTVILPQFHCYRCKYTRVCKTPGARCHLGTAYRIVTFDARLKDRYRESVFLSHDKVPASVKQSRSPLFFIDSERNAKDFPILPSETEKLAPNRRAGATGQEIERWFGARTESVLRFHSLYDGIQHGDEHRDRLKNLDLALAKSDYRQYG
ncbi:hypothetical protein LSH36_669g04027 [Paralvinella palmiformis]|uniref:Nucleotide-diphospho-sugar transferase domain-containing protein n=1 Tax=Paralvinella palmiformis TaxID=53620 RepID=A0AAD9MVG1_9ANNE|nr:hypothetical protein LSH36_669g04027 [Paralvinella palmiformis]